MKYNIQVSCRPNYLRMFKLNDDELDQVRETDSLEEAFDEIEENRDYDYDFEEEILCVDSHYYLTVSRENKNVVEVTSLIIPIRPIGDKVLEGSANWDESPLYNFAGMPTGNYLISNQLMKGSCWEGEIELDGDFDFNRLYYLKDDHINDELLGDDCTPVNQIYYRKGDKCDPETDIIILDFLSDNGDFSRDLYLAHVSEKDYWEFEREE